MSSVQVRPFRRDDRDDRDQLTMFVNAHAEAVVPAVGFRELTRTKRGWTRT